MNKLLQQLNPDVSKMIHGLVSGINTEEDRHRENAANSRNDFIEQKNKVLITKNKKAALLSDRMITPYQ